MPLRQGAPHDSSNEPQISLDVSRVRWIDVMALRSVRQRYFLNVPVHRLSSGNPVQAGLRQLAPLMPSNDRVFVARAEGRPVGYAVFQKQEPDRRWTLEGIGANLGVYEMEPVWDELVRFGVVAAGLEGTKRLYARVPTDAELTSVMRRSGFASYARELVLSAPMMSISQGGTGVRRQQASDVWAIHQLYMSVVPQPVQAAEALTSHAWDIQPKLLSQSLVSGWIVEDGYQVAAYLRAESRPDSHILEFIVNPDRRELFPRLLAGALADLASMAPRRAYVLVRGYQQEFVEALLERGFLKQLEQDLYVKYTTAFARVPGATVVNFPQEVKEPKGKRVPTFLKGSSGDPASESS